MTTASPTPMGHGSHITTLGRRTSARQALRRPTSRAALGRSESNPAPANNEARGDSQQPQSHSQPPYSTLNDDSTDDEIPVPMKLSALTKALLGDEHASSEASSMRPSALDNVHRQPSPPARPASRVTRRSVLSTSTSSATEERQAAAATRRESIRDREAKRYVRAGSAQSSRAQSPARSNDGASSPVQRKRVVRLTQPNSSMLQGSVDLPSRHRRSLSNGQRKRSESREGSVERHHPQQQSHSQQYEQQQQPHQQPLAPLDGASDINTPVVQKRTVRIMVGSSGNRARSGGSSRQGSAGLSDHEQGPEPQIPETVSRAPPGLAQGSVSRYSASVRKDLDAAPASSMRSMKRVSKIPGSFLSGPARRGRRRQSEEDAENQAAADEAAAQSGSSQEPENHQEQQPHSAEAGEQNNNNHGAYHANSIYAASTYRDFAATGSPVSAKDSARLAVRKQSPPLRVAEDHHREQSAVEAQKAYHDLPVYKAPAPAALVNLPSGHDKENEIPIPGFKSSINGQQPLLATGLDKDLIKPLRPLVDEINGRQERPVVQHASPERKVLGQKSQNQAPTPHRVAPPPPPKMSFVATATKAAGAAVTSKKRAVLLRVNDNVYTRIECVGRGGSSKVYRVSAENGSMYALKRVSIENADETTVKGFKGEIDLLKRLTGVERVIQLYDWEMNEEKQMLSLLMEIGELDMYTLFKSRIGHEGHKLDLVFVKFIWKEMLECLAAVHEKDIVHSDLKPANFVLVKGRLKLIDFGIANAIQTDETVNVHRENQIGTPSYMCPESLMDSSQYAFTAAQNSGRGGDPRAVHHPARPAKRLVKIGKPSDVWSLGCILYQMVYGETPFAHFPNQMTRCQAIINWNHQIDFPDRVGGTRVPLALIRTMKRCLNREQSQRPTCEEMLHDTDPFLYPKDDLSEMYASGKVVPVSEELLGRIIQSVVQRCRERMPTEAEAVSQWPMAYWASVRKNVGGMEGRQ